MKRPRGNDTIQKSKLYLMSIYLVSLRKKNVIITEIRKATIFYCKT